jgi:addiction module RelB/DinJ family antitoxin
MMETKVLQTRLDVGLWNDAEKILGQMGMSLNDGVRVFFNQVRNERALPFRPATVQYYEPRTPNNETLAALQDFKIGHHGQRMSLSEFKKYLDA